MGKSIMNEVCISYWKMGGFSSQLLYVNLSEGRSKWYHQVGFPSWNGACRNIRFRWARSRTHGSYGHAGAGDTKTRMNSVDPSRWFFNCELIGKTHRIPPKNKKAGWNWGYTCIFQKWWKDTPWSLVLFASDCYCSVSLLGLNSQELRGEHSICI